MCEYNIVPASPDGDAGFFAARTLRVRDLRGPVL